MTGKYWIKLYHEMVYERKIATLEDRLWRRMVECFLFAGEFNKNGILPPLVDMAYTLHVTEEELETDLNELIRIDVLEYRNGSYFVRNFRKRQEPMKKAEYMRRLREERQREEALNNMPELPDSYQPVTNSNVDTDTDTDTDTEEEPVSRISSLYENEIGLLTPMIREQVIDWVENYPMDWVEDAIKIAVERNKRRVDYVNGILKNWRNDGRGEKSTIEKELARKGYAQR